MSRRTTAEIVAHLRARNEGFGGHPLDREAADRLAELEADVVALKNELYEAGLL